MIPFGTLGKNIELLRQCGSRERMFRAGYRALLHEAVSCPEKRPPEPGSTLLSRKGGRRELPDCRSGIRVVGFGTDDDWRRNGLWAAFRRLTDFALFEVPDGPYPGCRNQGQERLLKERDFLAFVDRTDKEGLGHLAVFSHSGRHISDGLLDELHRRGIWTVIVSVDDKHQLMGPNDEQGCSHQRRVAAKADLYWSNWPLAYRYVNSLGGNAWFAPPAADPERYHPVRCAKDLDVVFVGARYGVRGKIIQLLQRYFRVAAFGHGWPAGPVSFEESVRLFSRAHVVLGIGGVGPTLAVQTLKGRDFEVPMCGAAYLTSANSELADHFCIGREIVCYSSAEDCIERLAALISDPEGCEAIGLAARQRCIQEHTWEHRVISLFGHWNFGNEPRLTDSPAALRVP
jgi:hypothetical protein